MREDPFFSIITVARNDAWSMAKTMRSVFEQTVDDFEYVVVDGASSDGTSRLVEFWRSQGLVSRAVSEPDEGVYNAMNKGLRMARGAYVIFMNAADKFAHAQILEQVQILLKDREIDGLLGWGELNDQIWASWVESEAFKIASLGFCHQALFVKRQLLAQNPFDDRSFKTDSDTLQLGRLYAQGARIPVLPEVLAVRGGEPGISADLHRTRRSIKDTLLSEYEGLGEDEADHVIDFRRNCEHAQAILGLLRNAHARLSRHLSFMVLDTLFQRASKSLPEELVHKLADHALARIDTDEHRHEHLDRLIFAQQRKARLLKEKMGAKRDLDRNISQFENEEEARIQNLRASGSLNVRSRRPDFVVSLTSFPARLKTVSFAIQSLFEQTCPPSEVHLWLGLDEVPGRKWLPKRLRALESHGLKINFADRTFHQYDKFLHNSDLNRERPFIIVDDDVVYPPDAFERLLDGHRRHPEAVVGNRCHRIVTDPDGTIQLYKDWEKEVFLSEPSHTLMATGAGGVLYPPGFLTDSVVTDVHEIVAHAPYADDIWLKFCGIAKGFPTFATELSQRSRWYHRYTPTMQEGTLMTTNVERGLNDFQIARCVVWLTESRPDLADKLGRQR